MNIQLAQRIKELPPYLFARIDELKAEAVAAGADIVDLGVGDPDLPTPPHIVDALKRAADDPTHHGYPSYKGMLAMRQAAADYYQRRFGVALDPDREVLSLIGSKEGIAHFPVAFVDPGDLVLVPNPGYPVYSVGTRFCGGEVYDVPLLRGNGFIPDLDAIPGDVADRAKVIWVNYPNNPTAALAPSGFYERLVEWAHAHSVIIASDVAYIDVYYGDGEHPRSLLSVDGARDVTIEFYSLSKTYNMTGWRVGVAVGNPALVGGLGKVKTNVDSGVFEAVQQAAIAGLSGSQECVAELAKVYRRRRDVLCGGLERAGFDVLTPDATFYTLIATPPGYTSIELAGKLLSEAHVVATPCTGFGAVGEGFVRLTMCAPEERLALAVERIAALKL